MHKIFAQPTQILRDSCIARQRRAHIILVLLLVLVIEDPKVEDEDENEKGYWP